jgi:hypothetical protein
MVTKLYLITIMEFITIDMYINAGITLTLIGTAIYLAKILKERRKNAVDNK